MVSELKLDLACGRNKRPGFTGVDKVRLDGVDIVWNLEKYPWPFEDNSVDEVFCSHYVEHTSDLIKFMNEVHRILKPGRDCMIIAPYYTSIEAWQDPNHRRAICETTFNYFNRAWREERRLDHYGVTADFTFAHEFTFTPEWKMRSEETQRFAARHYLNVVSEIKVTLTKNFSFPKKEETEDGQIGTKKQGENRLI